MSNLIKSESGVCPKCGGHKLISYTDGFQKMVGCLECEWKVVDE